MSKMFFPQLSTGALAQYPINRTKFMHTVVNSMEDGSRFVFRSGRLDLNLEPNLPGIDSRRG